MGFDTTSLTAELVCARRRRDSPKTVKHMNVFLPSSSWHFKTHTHTLSACLSSWTLMCSWGLLLFVLRTANTSLDIIWEAVTVRLMNESPTRLCVRKRVCVITESNGKCWRRTSEICSDVYVGGCVMSVHPTTIRDTWLAVIQRNIHRSVPKKDVTRNVWENFWQKTFVWITWLLDHSLSLFFSPLPTMFWPGHRRKCESRHRTWWSRRRVWPPPDGWPCQFV